MYLTYENIYQRFIVKKFDTDTQKVILFATKFPQLDETFFEEYFIFVIVETRSINTSTLLDLLWYGHWLGFILWAVSKKKLLQGLELEK